MVVGGMLCEPYAHEHGVFTSRETKAERRLLLLLDGLDRPFYLRADFVLWLGKVGCGWDGCGMA